jgi:hypothetical protein
MHIFLTFLIAEALGNIFAGVINATIFHDLPVWFHIGFDVTVAWTILFVVNKNKIK